MKLYATFHLRCDDETALSVGTIPQENWSKCEGNHCSSRVRTSLPQNFALMNICDR
jgi:hypothetical protein